MTTRVRIQVRRGTAAEWAAADPVLLAGEWGLDRTSNIVKIGDGVTAWSGLSATTAEIDAALGTMSDRVSTLEEGTVVGPAVATDNALARFDGTTGKLVQDSGVTVDDSGDVTVDGSVSMSGTGAVLKITGTTSETLLTEAYISLDDDPVNLTGYATTIQPSGLYIRDNVASENRISLLGTGEATLGSLTVSGSVSIYGNINGRDPDDLAKGAASSTDNALVRFDGTDGKTIQNSGIAVNDSGEITTNVTINRTIPTFTVSGSATGSRVYIDAPAATRSDLAFRTGTAARWQLSRSASAESGSDAGSNFVLDRFSDAGSATTALEITRATGKTTLGSVGATAGLELGASGPRVMSGTGSPEGVVSAPINSVWNRSDGDTLGDFVYHKRSGTGNTGWVVSEGDTGWRDVSASLINGWTTNVVYLRRLGSLVYLSVYSLVGTSASANQFYALPSGFRPYMSQYHPTTRNTVATQGGYVTSAGVAAMESSYAYTFHAQWIWPTNNTWPSSLPGSVG